MVLTEKDDVTYMMIFTKQEGSLKIRTCRCNHSPWRFGENEIVEDEKELEEKSPNFLEILM